MQSNQTDRNQESEASTFRTNRLLLSQRALYVPSKEADEEINNIS